MFFKIKSLISLILLLFVSNIVANQDLEVTIKGVFSNSQEEIISTLIKRNESSSYAFFIDKLSFSENTLFYEQYSQYKHQCYIPIKKQEKKYLVQYITCFELNISMNEPSSWIGRRYASNIPVELKEIDIKKIIDTGESSSWKILEMVEGVYDKKSGKMNYDGLNAVNSTFKTVFNSHVFFLGKEVDEYTNLPQKMIISDKQMKLISLINKKQYLFNKPEENKKTKMYLIKGDKVTLLDEKTDDSGQKWYFINYKGKKDLNMWIKAEAIDIEPEKETPQKPESSKTKEPELAPQTKIQTPIEVAKQKLVTIPPKNAEIIKAEKAEPIEKSASGSISLVLLVSTLGLLGWKFKNIM